MAARHELPPSAVVLFSSQWCDGEHELRYPNTLPKCIILLECGITWTEFHEIGITRAIGALGWKTLFDPSKLCSTTLVREFYANMYSKICNHIPMGYKVSI